jgi:hypothetical protein
MLMPWAGEQWNGRWRVLLPCDAACNALAKFVLDNLFASKYTIVKLKLQVKRSRCEVGENAAAQCRTVMKGDRRWP